MSLITKIKSFYSNYQLSTSKSILIAGAMVSLSIYSGSQEIKWELWRNGWQIPEILREQNSNLLELNELIKVANAPVTLDKPTFDRIFEICMNSSTEELGLDQQFNTPRQKHCLNKILKTDIK